MENKILEANLNCIAKYNKELAQKIENINKLNNIIELTQNENGQYNLVFNGLPVHDTKDAELEAKKILKASAHNNLNSMHIIYGLGLGYLFTEFAENAKGRIILYEPNLEVIRVAFELVDFTKELSNPNIILTTNINELQRAFNLKFLWRTQTNFVFLNFHKFVFDKDIEKVLKEIEYLQSMNISNFMFEERNLGKLLNSLLDNFPDKITIPELNILKDKFKNKPALVVSAGPSLAKNIETIKKYRDKIIIFCVGTAMKSLMNAGIKPDFLNVIEMHNNSAQFEDYDLSDVNVIMEPFTNKFTQSIKYKRRFYTCASETRVNRWFADMMKINSQEYETRGTVSYQALFSAMRLGCNPIILIGQDLSYSDGQCYSKDSAYGDLKCVYNEKTGSYDIEVADIDAHIKTLFGKTVDIPKEEQMNIAKGRLKQLKDSIVRIKDVEGKMRPADPSFVLFAKYLKEFAEKFKPLNLDLINSSFGAQIDGFENVPLEEILSKFDENINSENILSEINIKSLPFDKLKNINEKIQTEFKMLKNSLAYFEKGQKYFKNYKLFLARQRGLTNDVAKAFNDTAATFMEIYNFARTNSFFLQVSTFNEEIYLGWLLKEKNDEQDLKSLQMIEEAFYNYFFKSYDKTKQYLDRLEKICGEIDEMCTAKS